MLGRASLAVLLAAGSAVAEEKIRDNSFLLEEAYNQEDGVIQHVQLLQWDHDARAWAYTYTDEWPAPLEAHQLSLTIPVWNDPEDRTRFADAALNWRYQAVRRERVAFAPRLSLIVPTGDPERRSGKGGVGLQFGLPSSFDVADRVTLHVNGGGTWTPSTESADGASRATLDWNAGASAIWHVTPRVNLLAELVGNRVETVGPAGEVRRTSFGFVSPGVRFAIDRPSGLQIVPGFAYALGLGDASESRSVLFYLSFEYPLPQLAGAVSRRRGGPPR